MQTQWLASTWRRTMLVAALFAVLFTCAPQKIHALSASQLIALTNSQRTANGLPVLSYDDKLAASANTKAQHMIALGYWAHNAPDGTTPWVFVRNAGYVYTAVGENLAKDFSSDQAIVNAWMGSATHRANILNAKYHDIGIAVVDGLVDGKQTVIIVAHYGATAAVSNPRRLAPRSVATGSTPSTAQPSEGTKTHAVTKSKQVTATVSTSVPQTTQAAQPEKKPYERLLEQLAKFINRGSAQSIVLVLAQ